MRTIVVGVGNPILGDDGVGIHAARKLKEILESPDVDIEEAYTGGMNLLDLIVGYDRAIIIDAFGDPDMDIGDVVKMDPGDLDTAHSMNPHDASLPEAIELAKKAGEGGIPDDIIIIGINIVPTNTFSEGLSPEVEGGIPVALNMIKDEIEQ